jgi:hypothetical protein
MCTARDRFAPRGRAARRCLDVQRRSTLHPRGGGERRMAVMAIWTLDDGKVAALREVDAEI